MPLKRRSLFLRKPVGRCTKESDRTRQKQKKRIRVYVRFCWRHHKPKQEVFGRILDGGLGDVHAMYSTYNGGEVWKKSGRMDGVIWKPSYETGMPTYGSLDSIVEQAVHCIDMMQWAMEDQPPLHAEGSGGRQVYDDPDKYGNIYDHFACFRVGEWG